MIIDSSAIIAILMAEPESEDFRCYIDATKERYLSVANYLEVALVLRGRLAQGSAQPILDDFLASSLISLVPVTEHQGRLAIAAFERFGKGQHKAGLNFGDCFAYALAKSQGAPLLFKGEDFRHTDIEAAV